MYFCTEFYSVKFNRWKKSGSGQIIFLRPDCGRPNFFGGCKFFGGDGGQIRRLGLPETWLSKLGYS